MSLVIKYSEGRAVPEGVYVAKVVNLEPQHHSQYGDGIKWSFEIMHDAENEGVQVTAISSLKVSPKSKLYSWVRAFGITLVPGEDFDLESLLGKVVRIKVENKVQSKLVDGKTSELTFSNVVAVAPYTPSETDTQATKSTEETASAASTPAPAPAPAPPVSEIPSMDDDADFNF